MVTVNWNTTFEKDVRAFRISGGKHEATGLITLKDGKWMVSEVEPKEMHRYAQAKVTRLVNIHGVECFE